MTTENQTHIPEGWKESELGAVIVEKAKSTIKVSNAANFGEFPFFTSGDSILLHDRKIIEGENLFLATGGVANIKYFKGEAAYSTDTFAISTNEDTKAQYLYYYLLSKVGYINKNYFEGSGLKHLQKKDFRKHVFVLPSSPTEQRKIASILSKLDEAITQTEQLIGKYKKIKEGLMHDLLTRGIDEQGNIRSEEMHKFKDSPLGRIPEEWGIKCLNDCIDTSTTITYGIVQTFEHIENGVPVLRTLDLKEDELNPIENLLRTKKKISDSYKRTILKKNDIVCNVRASVGDYNLITDIYENCNTTRGVARICPSKEFDNLYLLRFLQSYINKKQMEFYIKGTTFLDINIADLKKILVLIPDYNEQKRISRSLQAVQDMIKREQNQLSKYILQKSGLMHDLLTGKIRVQI
jgi:type I restriction enzyme S subunit